MYYVTTSYDYCINAVKNSDVKKWFEKKKIFSFEETRFALMNKAFEHQTHHRGQTTIYIRLQGIKPPKKDCSDDLKYRKYRPALDMASHCPGSCPHEPSINTAIGYKTNHNPCIGFVMTRNRA